MSVGSAAIAGVIAQIAFWLLIVLGWSELGPKKVAVFVGLWLAALFGLPTLSAFGGLYFTPVVAILDIVLVFMVLQRDIHVFWWK